MIDARAFKKNDAPVGTTYPFSYGAYDAEGDHHFGAVVNEHSFCRPGTPSVTVAVLDSDSDGDDAMGSTCATGSVDYSSGIDLGDARIAFKLTQY